MINLKMQSFILLKHTLTSHKIYTNHTFIIKTAHITHLNDLDFCNKNFAGYISPISIIGQ